jgi:copper homeostasis protein
MAPARSTLLEIAANSLASALAAQEGGADRIELCTALELGGLTPTHAQISLARERVRLPIHVLIRPRGGDFVYTDCEFEAMQRDIQTCVALGCAGVVIGALDAAGGVDARCSALVGAAGKLDVTFHRAIDMSRDPLGALEAIVALGCRRVLTSGARASALDGVATIRALIAQSNGRIAVMPGAGIDATNIAAIRRSTGAHEFHASAKRRLPSRGTRTGSCAAGMEEGELRTDIDQVRALVAALRPAATTD